MIKKGILYSLLALVPLFILIQTWYFITHEQSIYYWDYNGYWRSWEDFVKLLNNNPDNAFEYLKKSVLQDDYNILPIALPAILSDLNLPSRLLFIELLNLLYLAPVIYLFYLTCNVFTDKSFNKNLAWRLVTLVTPLFFVSFWSPSLKGYPDISGLIFVLAAILISSKFDLSQKIRFTIPLLLGLTLWGPFLFRRWYAFTVVSLYFSIPILNYYIYNGLKIVKKKIFFLFLNFFFAGSASCALVFLFQFDLLDRVIHTNYADIYQAYQAPLSTSIKMLIKNIGIYILPFFFFGIASSMISRERKEKSIVLFSAFNLVFSFILFTRTQAPGIQHCLPFALWTLIICIFGVKFCLEQIKNRKAMWSFTFVFLFIHCYIFGTSVNHTTRFYANWCKALLPTKSYPLVIENYENYLTLVNKIKELTQGGGKITVFASNDVLNDDMLNTISNLSLSKSIYYASQVDLRDGMRVNSLMSDYFLITSPAQIHLKASGQQVITIPVEQISNNNSIGQSMIKLDDEYVLAEGVRAKIYKRVRPYTPKEVDQFFSLLFKSYPQWNGLYNIGLPYTYLSTKVLAGDVWGSYGISYDGKIVAHPGETTPTIFSWDLRGVDQLNIKSVNTTCQNADGVDISISALGHKTKSVHIDNGKFSVMNVTEFNGITSKLTVDKHINSACDSIEISSQ